MLIREFIPQPPAVVHRDMSLGEVARLMLARRLAGVAVVDERGELCGIITEEHFAPEERLVPFSFERLPKLFGQWMPKGDIRKAYEAARELKAKDIMEVSVIAVSEDTPVEEAMLKMQQHSARHLVVVRGNVPLGVFSCRDVLLMMT